MFRPLLAEKIKPENVQYPVFASPKYDGFRCIINKYGEPVSRNMKPVFNAYVFAKLEEMGLPPLDGELLTFTNDKVDNFNTVQSKLTTRTGRPEFKFMVFDNWAQPELPFIDRNLNLAEWWAENCLKFKRIEHVKQKRIETVEELLDYEAECLSQNWEGVMVRSFEGKYKYGRSTAKEGILLKIKRFFDAEAEVISQHELMHNANEATYNALGYKERSSHQANMVGMGMLGKFTVRIIDTGVEFDIGTGFNESQRREYWSESQVGKTLTYKFQSVGPNGKPRFPVFLGFRSKADMDGDIPF